MPLQLILDPGGVNINLNPGGVNPLYAVRSFNIGSVNRQEVWIDPFGAIDSTLAATADARTQMSLILKVTAATSLALVNAMEAVRNALDNPAGNTMTYSPDTTTVGSKTITIYRTAVEAVDLSDADMYKVFTDAHQIVQWPLVIWRRPYLTGDTRGPVI